MDKSVITVTSLAEEPDDRSFWLSKTPQERLAALELMRAVHYGYDPATARLQRVLAVAKLGAD
jgi:hypothetical protein